MSTFSYSVEPYRCYFLKDLNDKVWRIVFNSFEGSSTGIIEFNTEEMTSSTSISNLNNDISSFSIYPNPTAGNNLTVVFENSSKTTELNIFDITGKNVYQELFEGIGFQAKSINLPNLNNGVYIVSLSSKGSIFQKKLVVR
tara:strand:- start:275 stop:697 length:423 start_codon:yes stop_codon:yes gene_type:complete